MRLRFPELLDERDITPYGLHKQSEGRISLSTAYRITRQRGRVKMFDAELLETLCDVLDADVAELLERESPKRRRR
jgi:DNA-binding Xre family transcriptional regulator